MPKHLKILKNDENHLKLLILTEKAFISSEPLEEFQLNFQERCNLILKVTKNQGFNLSLEHAFLVEPEERSN